MPSLKDLRGRINSVKSTRKITQAMKMVAAAKLRRAQSQAEAARPYAERMEAHARLARRRGGRARPGAPRMLVGTGAERTHLLVVVTADRGLAGAFNTNVGRLARARVRALEAEGKTVKLLTVGRKGAAYLKREFADRVAGEITFMGKKRVEFADAEEVGRPHHRDAGRRRVRRLHPGLQPLPQRHQPGADRAAADPGAAPRGGGRGAPRPAAAPRRSTSTSRPRRRSSPSLLPRNLAIQIYRALLENAAGFYGSQMSAMDNATRNAGDMIDKLTLNYNRTRQANITRELIEIISGAEAL